MLRQVYIKYKKSPSSKNETVLPAYAECIAVTNDNVNLLYASIVAKGTVANSIQYLMKNHYTMTFVYKRMDLYLSSGAFEMRMHRGRENYTHIIFTRKVAQANTITVLPVFLEEDNAAELVNGYDGTLPDLQRIMRKPLYESIRKNTTVPILEEWMDYIISEMKRDGMFSIGNLFYSFADKKALKERYGFQSVICAHFSSTYLETKLTSGLKRRDISIDGCNKISENIKDITGIDSYQNRFGQELATKTKETFHPVYDPETTPISRKVNGFFNVCQYYLPRIRSFQKQKEVIQAGIMSLDYNKNLVISGETGAGGIYAVFC